MRRLVVGGLALSALTLAGCGGGGAPDGAPMFVVDALWPQPLEYPYILGPVSGVTVAPDGNVLIAETNNGRAFEVTPEGETVWEFINPNQVQEGDLTLIASLWETIRLPESYGDDWLDDD